jgi:hypothetical protein
MSQINLIIDSEDQNAVRAALSFFQTLSGETVLTVQGENETTATKAAEQKSPRLDEEKLLEQTPKIVDEACKKTEPVKEPEKPAEKEETISLNDLRQLVAKKAKTHKPEIREWLQGKGYSKTPELPQELYAEYVEFLNTL